MYTEYFLWFPATPLIEKIILQLKNYSYLCKYITKSVCRKAYIRVDMVFKSISMKNYLVLPLVLFSLCFFSACKKKKDDPAPQTPKQTKYIWASTTTGVYRYDGATWTNLTKANSGLTNDYVFTTFVDDAGNKWFGTTNGLSKFDNTNWTTYNTAQGLSGSTILSINKDNKGNIWFGTDNGTNSYDGTTWKKHNANHTPYKNVFAITFDNAGNGWFGTNYGISKFDGTSTWSEYNEMNVSLIGYNYQTIKSIAVESNGTKWFGANSGAGVYIFNDVDWTYLNSNNSGLKTSGYVTSIVTDSKGIVWLGLNFGGVAKYDGKTVTTYTALNSNLVSSNVTSLCFDSEENLWVATQGGISKFDGTNWTTYLSGQLINAVTVE